MKKDNFVIEVPDYFIDKIQALKLSTMSFFYYFNSQSSHQVNVQVNQHMLIHIFNGRKVIQEDKIQHEVKSGQSVFISKGLYSMSEILCQYKEQFDGMMVFFDDEFLLAMFNKYPALLKNSQSYSKNDSKVCIIESSEGLDDSMRSVHSYIKRKSDNELLVQLKFEEIFLHLLQSEESSEILKYFQHLHSNSLYEFKKLVEKNSFDSVEQMIQESKLSEPQFRKTFDELYQMAPKEWLLKKALLKAKKLLSNKDLNVTQVCFETGFNSLSWFIKSFKKEFGQTPKRFQQNC